MIKKIAWDTFKNTGDINTFLEFKQFEEMQNNLTKVQEIESIQKITNMTVEQQGDQNQIQKVD